MSVLYLFNPENDLALANGCSTYYPPPAARKIAADLSILPIWYASKDDKVLLSSASAFSFAEKINTSFRNTARGIVSCNIADVTSCSPWGWSSYVLKHFLDCGVPSSVLPTPERIDKYRRLSNRRTTIDIFLHLKESGIDVPDLMPEYITTVEGITKFICSMPLSVVKAPWSGSGKGIVWGRGTKENATEQICRGVIRRQGGMVCEEFLDNKMDFAMEFYSDKNDVHFAGYSMFRSEKGCYTGNILASDSYIESRLEKYIPLGEINNIKINLERILHTIINGCYTGYAGVDMMVYYKDGRYRVNPCVELNMRMNMGAVSRIFYDRYVNSQATGCFEISYSGKTGELLKEHIRKSNEYPLSIENGKVVSGYMPLAPVLEDSNYTAYALIDKP